jgi:hypothetical protein
MIAGIQIVHAGMHVNSASESQAATAAVEHQTAFSRNEGWLLAIFTP